MPSICQGSSFWITTKRNVGHDLSGAAGQMSAVVSAVIRMPAAFEALLDGDSQPC